MGHLVFLQGVAFLDRHHLVGAGETVELEGPLVRPGIKEALSTGRRYRAKNTGATSGRLGHVPVGQLEIDPDHNQTRTGIVMKFNFNVWTRRKEQPRTCSAQMRGCGT